MNSILMSLIIQNNLVAQVFLGNNIGFVILELFILEDVQEEHSWTSFF